MAWSAWSENCFNCSAGLEEVRPRRAHEALQRLDLPPLRLDHKLRRRRSALRFQFLDEAQAGLDLVVNVLGYHGHLLDRLLFEAEGAEGVLQLAVALLEAGVEPGAFGRGRAVLPLGVSFIGLLIRGAHHADELAQSFEVRLVVVEFLVENDAVEPLFGRLASQFFRQSDMLLGGETEAADDAFDFGFGGFDALGDFHLLLPRQQGAWPICRRYIRTGSSRMSSRAFSSSSSGSSCLMRSTSDWSTISTSRLRSLT